MKKRLWNAAVLLLAVLLIGCGAGETKLSGQTEEDMHLAAEETGGSDIASGEESGSDDQDSSPEEAGTPSGGAESASEKENGSASKPGKPEAGADGSGSSSVKPGSTPEEENGGAAKPGKPEAGADSSGSPSVEAGSTSQPEDPSPDPSPAPQTKPGGTAEELLASLTLEEKVAQMFVVQPESLTGASHVTAAGQTTREAFDRIPVGGVIYMQSNLVSPEQVKTMLSNTQSYSMERLGIPAFLAVDEEGGTVARIGGRPEFGTPAIENMSEVGASGKLDRAREIGSVIGGYLSELGFNLDFAPVADVWSNPQNEVVRYRSFGSDPEMVSNMCQEVLTGLQGAGIYGTLKHFPGHGGTAGDTHAGYAYTDSTLEELLACELVPFQRGIDNGVKFLMVGHISAPNVTGDETPASLSRVLVTEVLRERMGYDGIVVTDALAMGAIAQNYSSGEAAVLSIQAGVDILLMPKDLEEAYEAVLTAVRNGTISEDRIDQSVLRILRVKLSLM